MLNEFRSQKIIWDIANREVYEKIEAHEGDSNGRKLIVQVINANVVENLTGANLSLAWRLGESEGLDAFRDVDISKGIFEIYYTTEMLSNVGTVKASLVLVDTKGRIESKPFDIKIYKSNVDDDAVQSSNSFTALTQALVKVNDFDNRLNNTNKRIDNIISTPTEISEQEIIDARYDAVDDVLYDSIGERLNQDKLDYIEHLNSNMPHKMKVDGRDYKYGFSQENGFVKFVYEEVI